MIDRRRRHVIAALAAMGAGLAAADARAESAAVIDGRVDRALEELFATVPGARDLHDNAKGVLIMPDIVKGGLFVGGAYGEGALRVQGQTVGYYSLAAASLGFQIGVQSTKQALFFMTDAALERFRRADGWQIGADAEFTVPGDGISLNIGSTTQQQPVVAVIFGQDGLLAGASFAGGKYSRIER